MAPIHGDLNSTNVLFHRNEPRRIKLIDWEWAGFGLPHSDLASLFKTVSPELEARGLSAYGQACERAVAMDVCRVYQWCKLQRGIFDAAFFAKQTLESEVSAETNMDGRIEKALGRALQAFLDLESSR